MLTMTTLDDSATPSPTAPAPNGGNPAASAAPVAIAAVMIVWSGAMSRS